MNKKGEWAIPDYKMQLNKGEAAFAASNTNIASSENYLWIATGGMSSRILRQNLKTQKWEILIHLCAGKIVSGNLFYRFLRR